MSKSRKRREVETGTPVTLFPRGTTLADVPPDFRGMPWREYLLERVSELGREYTAQREDATTANPHTQQEPPERARQERFAEFSTHTGWN